MKKVIVYTSSYGHTRRYAFELANKTNLPLIDLKEIKKLDDYNVLIYLAPLIAGNTKSLKKVLKKFGKGDKKTLIVVTVGVSSPLDDMNVKNINNNIYAQTQNTLFDKISIYHLRGGVIYSKLKPLHRIIMKLIYKISLKTPVENRREVEQTIIDTYGKDIDFTNLEALDPIIQEINQIN